MIASVEHDFTLELGRIVPADLRQRAIGHSDQQDVAECDGLADGTGLRQCTEICHEIL